MTPGDFGIVAGSTMASFVAGLVRGKRTRNGNEPTQNGNGNGNGHVKRSEYHELRDSVHAQGIKLEMVSKQVEAVGETTTAIQEDLTNLRIDLGAKR
jgi:hypothetical protein